MDSNAGVLQGIAEQLSTQITFANDLMSRLQGLETQHAMFQRQASEKQAQLRSASAALESSRSECADLRRKLAVAQVCSFLGPDARLGRRLFFVRPPRIVQRFTPFRPHDLHISSFRMFP